MAQNVQMPKFTSASGHNNQSYWGDVDNFDVDMLAEYLLDDGTMNPNGVSFDFLIDSADHGTSSNMVSPENSEDGILPPVADIKARGALITQQFAAAPIITPPLLTGVPLAPAPSSATVFPTLGAPQMQNPSHLLPGAAATSLTLNAPKRRRLENAPGGAAISVAAAAPHAGAAAKLNGQHLAEAAAQAMQEGRGRKKSQAQVDRRRERNRILARRTRLRKKFFFESLQKEVMDLQRENEHLKEVVKVNIEGEEGRKILQTCDAVEKMPPGILEACMAENSEDMDPQDFNLVKSIQGSQNSFIITDPSLTDNPIVFASDGFLELTGYSRDQVLGRNCRFLQGTDTNKESVDGIRKALSSGEDASVTILNYTADGTPFWNKLFIAALRDAQNNIVNFIGVVVKVASPEPGHPEHGKFLDGVKTGNSGDKGAESTIMAMEDSVTAAVAAATGGH